MTYQEEVRLLLALHGVQPSPHEIELIASMFAHTRVQAERIWKVQVGDTPPAKVFHVIDAAEGYL